MESYTRLSKEERHQIYALKQAGQTQAAIALILERSPSTISRELRRNRGQRGYRPKQANEFAQSRMCEKSKPRFDSVVWERIDQLLLLDWSPEQISGWIDKEEGISISHEWIYQYVYNDKKQGGDLHSHLRCQKKRRKRYGSNDRRGQIKGRVSIDERPSIVDERKRIGDWEMDTVIGEPGGAVLVTMVERLSRFSLAMWAPNKTAEAVKNAIVKALHPLADRVHTLTYDNGKEFAYHADISKVLQAEGFFAHPYHSWERGLNENTNGLIRQYLPKRSSFDSLTQENIDTIRNQLNNRPRKCLGFKTPNQVFLGIDPSVALAS